MFSKALVLIAGLGLLPCVEAGTWDDFVNNLSTDLAPLVSLFGETVTKQWLSESLTIWDNLIFAMGPLGVITAVVSAIRVAGSPSLKAFIGRAQESPGTAELELLSCTSGTTSELWNQGGIARVFGRPHILEVVRRSDSNEPIELIDESTAWIIDETKGGKKRSSAEKLKADASTPRSSDVERGFSVNILEVEEHSLEDEDDNENLGSPNLSLNIGIHRKSTSWYRAAAAMGVILQSAVLAFGALSVYRYPSQFPIAPKQLSTTLETDGFTSAPSWAFPITFCGMTALCSGMFLCAFIIERSTNETYFRKVSSISAKQKGDVDSGPLQSDVPGSEIPPRTSSKHDEADGDIYWIQMGDQNVGDQVFNACIAKHPSNQDYVRSQKRKVVKSSDSVLLWCALVITLVGFIIQFVGLRYLHPSVALAQLGLTIFMSIVRSGLRTQRLNVDGNLVRRRNSRSINGHELDFFVLYVETPRRRLPGAPLDVNAKDFRNLHEPDKFFVRLPILENVSQRSCRAQRATRMLKMRSRLAFLTSPPVTVQSQISPLTRSLEWKDFEVRAASRVLGEAVESVIKEIYKMPGRKIRKRPDYEFFWAIKTDINAANRKPSSRRVGLKMTRPFAEDLWAVEHIKEEGYLTLRLTRGPRPNGVNDAKTPWKICFHEVEAMLGLWSWSRSQGQVSRRLAFYNTEDERNTGIREFGIWVPFENQSLEKGLQIDAKNDSYYGFQPPAGKTFHIAVSTHSSKIMMCAQDLFMGFLLQAADELIDNFGGQTTLRVGKENGDIELANSHLEAMVSGFEESGLGSRDDAYACIFSTLRLAEKQPLIEDSFERIRATANSQPKTWEGFKQAEILLNWIVQNSKTEHKRAAKVDLGELYRNSIVHNAEKSELQRLGFQGMLSLLNFDSMESSDLVEVALSYAWIGKRIAIDQEEHEIAASFSNSQILNGLCLNYDKISGAPWEANAATSLFSQCDTTVIKYLLGTPSHGLDINIQDHHGRSALSWAAQLNQELAFWLLKQPGINPANESIMFDTAESGDSELLQALLENDASSINKLNAKGKSLLMTAVQNCHEAAVQVILNHKYGAIPSSRDRKGTTALHLATANNHFSIARLLVDRKREIDIDALDESGRSALSNAVENGNLDMVTYLIYEGANFYHADQEHVWSAMGLASKGGYSEIVEILFEKLGDHFQREEYFRIEEALADTKSTALLQAAKGGHLIVAEMLISKGANVDCQCKLERTALFEASAAGHTSIVKLLCEHTALFDRSSRLGEDQLSTPLLIAAANGHEDIVALLISLGADMYPPASYIDDNATTIIGEAAGHGHLKVAKLLLENGVDINLKDKKGMTAVSHASRSGELEVVNYLISQHADLELKDENVTTPLGHATQNNRISVVQALLSAGALDFEVCTPQTLLSQAAYEGYAEVVVLFLDNGVDPNMFADRYPHPRGDYALIKAVQGGQLKTVEILLDRGANPDGLEKSFRELSPLSLSARTGRIDILNTLLAKKANVNNLDSYLCTPLFYAVKHGDIEAVRILLDQGAELEYPGNDETPLFQAACNGHLEIVNLLLERGARTTFRDNQYSPIRGAQLS